MTHIIPWKNENAVYRLQISTLVSEIFKSEKCVKYADEMTDDVMLSTQFYIEYVNRTILANLQHKTLKFGRLTALQETHMAIKNSALMATHSFQSTPTWFQYVMKYVFEKHTTRLQTQANTIICLLGDAYEAPWANIKIEHQRWSENPLILGRTWNPW